LKWIPQNKLKNKSTLYSHSLKKRIETWNQFSEQNYSDTWFPLCGPIKSKNWNIRPSGLYSLLLSPFYCPKKRVNGAPICLEEYFSLSSTVSVRKNSSNSSAKKFYKNPKDFSLIHQDREMLQLYKPLVLWCSQLWSYSLI